MNVVNNSIKGYSKKNIVVMSYTELESGYQGLKKNRPGFYVGHDGNLIALVSDLFIFINFSLNFQDLYRPTLYYLLVVKI